MLYRKPVEPIRVFEYGRVILPPNKSNAKTRERIEAAARKAGLAAFELRGRALYARGVVGVIDIGDVVIEVLPKTHDQCTGDEGKRFLVDLLRFASSQTRLAAQNAWIDVNDRSVLEMILSWAVKTAAANIRSGLPRRYVSKEEPSSTVRGRIDLRKSIGAKPGEAFRLVVRHAPMSEDNPITRIVRWLLLRISRVTLTSSTRSNCTGLLKDLAGVSDVSPTLSDFDRIALQPLEAHWEPLLRFARSLVQEEAPDPTRAGQSRSISVLFTLHDLFENALRKVFRAGLPKMDVHLRSLGGPLLYPGPENVSSPLLQLRPDFAFASRRWANPVIGDAKWKTIVDPAGNVKLSQDDAYQLTTYMSAFRADCGFVFCPLTSPRNNSLVKLSWVLHGTVRPIHVVAIDVPTLISPEIKGAQLRSRLCRMVFDTVSNGFTASGALQLQ